MDHLLFLGALTAPAENLSVFDPVSPPAAAIRQMFILVLAITGAIFLIVEGVLLYSLFTFRRTNPADNVEPPQVYGSLPIEIAWTAAPALIVFVLLLVLIRTELEIRVDPRSPPTDSEPLYITAIGHQWWWEYVYDGYKGAHSHRGRELGFKTANELHMPASTAGIPRPCFLKLESADVCHSYWVPRLAGKIDLIPGRTNHLWFQTDKPGTYLGQCAEYCGTQHANMLLRVVVDPVETFETWLENEAKPAVAEAGVKSARDAFLEAACINCHRVRGTPAGGSYGPDLTHLMSRQTLAAGMVPNNRDELRKWVVDPNETKAGCLMPAMQLSPERVDRVVDYLRSLK